MEGGMKANEPQTTEPNISIQTIASHGEPQTAAGPSYNAASNAAISSIKSQMTILLVLQVVTSLVAISALGIVAFNLVETQDFRDETKDGLSTCNNALGRVENDLNTPRIPLPGMAPGTGTKTKIVLAQDVDWPPYAYFAVPPEGDFVIAGFGHDVAHGLESVCPHLEVTTVQTPWTNCWNDGQITTGLLDGHYHGCMTYTQTVGERNRFMEFSHAILDENKPAGILTKLDSNGKPLVSPKSDLNGKKIVDVVGWAPTADTVGLVTNGCTGQRFTGFEVIQPTHDTGNANDDALKTLLEGDADAMWVYADQAAVYQPQAGVEENWDTTLWADFGTKYAYIQTGLDGHTYNGTTLTIAKLGSGLASIVNPCIQKFLKTKAYYDICVKHGFESSCYKNEHFPNNNAAEEVWFKKTSVHTGGCSTGYCSCDAAD